MSRYLRRITLAAGASVLIASLAACTAPAADLDRPVELSLLVPATTDVDFAEALADAFEAQHENITIAIENRPTGAEGENVVKTRLATGEMTDLFVFNSGALLTTISPDQSLVDLSGEDWASVISEDFTSVVSGEEGMYGVPWGTTRAGGIMYNKTVYADLGLEVPQTWEQFEKNNAAIADAGLTPVVQTYGDAFTSQLIVLGDFANVLDADPDWADEYTANNRKFADEPALTSFQKLADLADAGVFNEDFASAKYDEGIRRVAQGEAAHFPMLTNYVATNVSANYPDTADDIGFFAVPTSTSDEAKLTMWMPLGAFIAKSIAPEKLDAAKEFLAFIASPEGCAVHAEVASPAGPYLIEGCEVPDTAMPIVTDVDTYFSAGESAPALEFLSPVKGSSLPQFAVEVGSGMRNATDAAALYDNDVLKQAQQLGLPGW
ncbi:extracellular solute-binding protein [Microbacterium sp. M28]|uniref:ABC transporter substrate-binding protein n=1 Tax=Microbacterium sp. M28 TaxID=2962064 RepID=UPI0021F41044|nr:extracellular solute-binding protein [Microbacterium sp. M28]UYO97109.1 extracellular solute-binding protein [Microbacterium sp. M28]